MAIDGLQQRTDSVPESLELAEVRRGMLSVKQLACGCDDSGRRPKPRRIYPSTPGCDSKMAYSAKKNRERVLLEWGRVVEHWWGAVREKTK
ncbi:hypothetical protein NDU88_002949 [Pleurodeles waltl]|uniref:Uncharacterized protein n=1 Tax=Pleurodeles waltl TaxID=8319 RepID=A0AAV7UX32_PLEWA|nr:hypothetical protein NDU88_002949 [Pleurodeles waltl]